MGSGTPGSGGGREGQSRLLLSHRRSGELTDRVPYAAGPWQSNDSVQQASSVAPVDRRRRWRGQDEDLAEPPGVVVEQITEQRRCIESGQFRGTPLL